MLHCRVPACGRDASRTRRPRQRMSSVLIQRSRRASKTPPRLVASAEISRNGSDRMRHPSAMNDAAAIAATLLAGIFEPQPKLAQEDPSMASATLERRSVAGGLSVRAGRRRRKSAVVGLLEETPLLIARRSGPRQPHPQWRRARLLSLSMSERMATRSGSDEGRAVRDAGSSSGSGAGGHAGSSSSIDTRPPTSADPTSGVQREQG